MKTAYTISAIGHAAVLLWSVWSLAAKPLAVPPGEALPVDVITTAEFSQITAGNKSAPKSETPKPVAEKIAEAKPAEDPTAKVVEKKEVKAARETPPSPESKPVEAKPEEAQTGDQAGRGEARSHCGSADQGAIRKKSRPRSRRRRRSRHRQLPSSIPSRWRHSSTNAIRLASQPPPPRSTIRLRSACREATPRNCRSVNSKLCARASRNCGTCPAGAKDPQELVVQVRIKLKPDATLAAPPTVLTNGKTALFLAARDSAIRAILRGQPFDMLRPEHYEQWKDIEITFDPRDMIRG